MKEIMSLGVQLIEILIALAISVVLNIWMIMYCSKKIIKSLEQPIKDYIDYVIKKNDRYEVIEKIRLKGLEGDCLEQIYPGRIFSKIEQTESYVVIKDDYTNKTYAIPENILLESFKRVK